jgi:cbb3-type cytochrome oxidase subunit 3
MYRRYTTLHLLLTLAGFSIAAVWIILSASRHSQAKSDCQSDFFASTTTESLAETLCNIFPWVDVGLMSGLWVLLAISQVCPGHCGFCWSRLINCFEDILLCCYLLIWFRPANRSRKI